MENTINTLKHIKLDALYGKKKHFNAAARKGEYHKMIGIPLFLLNIITGSVLFYVVISEKNTWLAYIPLVFAFIASILSGLQTFFNFQKTIEGHLRVGNNYLSIMKKCDRLQGYIADGIVEKDSLKTKVEEIAKKVDRINREAESYPTNKKDYEKSRQGVSDGEEEYRKDELAL